MNILGVRVDNLAREEILSKVQSFLREDIFYQLATINPEFILAAQKDENFKNILNGCDLNVADGIGIRFAFWRFGKRLKARIAGAELLEEILKIAVAKKYKVFLAASSGGLSSWEETRETILKKYPDMVIGGVNSKKISLGQESRIADYEIVFCNFGAPQQEKFLHSLKLRENSKIRLAMGVGGSFDFLTSKISRAPRWMRRTGLEWLWRFILEPKYRAKRIWNAVIFFPLKVIFSRNK